MVKRLGSVLLVILLLLVAAPALADERLTALPTFSQPASGALDIAVAIRVPPTAAQATAIAYGHGIFSGDRLQLSFVDTMSGESIDILVIGTQVYARPTGSGKWTVINPADATLPISSPTMEAAPADMMPTITRIDQSEQVQGVDTSHYQLWISAANLPSAVADVLKQGGIETLTEDMFVGVADNMLRKQQSNVMGTDPQAGAYKIETPVVYSAINQPQTIEAPPPDLIQTVVATSLAHVPGAKALPAWERPVVSWLLSNHR